MELISGEQGYNEPFWVAREPQGSLARQSGFYFPAAMKGFYIEVTNNLLEKKHRKNMGNSVWEFMWCLDKITSVNEQGIGKVLGGKPIKLQDIAEDLGIHRDTVSENLINLENFGYINRIIAPYGIVISINKAKKRFGKKTEPEKIEVRQNSDAGSEKTPNLGSEKTPNLIKTDTKETITKDITIGARPPEEEYIKLFEMVNPNFKEIYKNKTERSAVKWLLEKYGTDDLRKKIAFLPKLNAMPYAPTVTSPYELKVKMGKIMAFLAKEQNKVELGKQKIFK